MNEPTPSGPEHVPDHVLEELLGAFAEDSAPQYNFDDPSIDRILGITDEHSVDGRGAREADRTTNELDDAGNDLTGDDLEVVEIDVDHLEPATPDERPAAVATVRADPAPSSRRTIVIAEDDRPDSVYLDEDKEKGFHARRESADESGERSTIA